MLATALAWLLVVCAALSACNTGEAPPANDAGATADLQHCLIVDDMMISHGCNQGSMGPGDRDDGGGAPAAMLPDAGGGMNLPFGAACDYNSECASDICFDYRVKGFFCTQLCTTNADCPSTSLGCNGQGVCRVGN